MKCRNPIAFGTPANDDRRGFTLVELLVIIGMIAVLATIQVSALASAKGRTRVAMCASNARQLALALHLYANENGNKLPPGGLGGAWAWDIPTPWLYQMLLSVGKQKRTFYCPGTAPRFTDYENFADPLAFSTPTRTLWTFGMPAGGDDAAPGFHIFGYLLSLANNQLLISNRNTSILAEPVKTGGPPLPAPPNAERVLVADTTISAQAPSPGTYTTAQKLSYNYTDIAGGFYKSHTSPHLNGAVPAGANVAFKDGHVAWRKFEDMDQRATGPGFWW